MRISMKQPRRAGFTLVELMVAMALIVLIMSLLAEAFGEASQTFRNLKAVGDMQESLRTAVVPLRHDLLQRHVKNSNGHQRLSKLILEDDRPLEGFFRIQQGSRAVLEGNDADGLPEYLATNHILHMAVILTGQRRADYMTVEALPASSLIPPVPPEPDPLQTDPFVPIPVPPDPASALWSCGPVGYQKHGGLLADNVSYSGGALNSQVAEVIWWLEPMLDPQTQQQMTAGVSSTPLWSLHRRQKLLAIGSTVNAHLNEVGYPSRILEMDYGRYPEIATRPDLREPGFLYFTQPEDLIHPSRRALSDNSGSISFPYPLGFPYPTSATSRHQNFPPLDSVGAAIGTASGMGTPAIPEPITRIGEDRVIADVISFEVKVLINGFNDFMDIEDVQTAVMAQSATTAFPGGVGIFDTANWPMPLSHDPILVNPGGHELPPQANPNGDPIQDIAIPDIHLRAVKITIRVWDAKTEQTRQVTLIQDL